MRLPEKVENSHRQRSFQQCMYHEINNPLAAIMATVEILQMKHRQLPPTQIDAYIKRLMKGMMRIQSLLDLTMSSWREPRIKMEGVQVGVILDNMDQLFRDQMDALELDFQLMRGESDRQTIRGDLHSIEEILINLIKNALEASEPGNQIVLSTRPGPDQIGFIVADNGSGIPPDERESMFQPFVTSKTYGSGFGLYYARYLAERMGGHIMLGENPEGGTLATAVFLVAEKSLDNH